MLVSSLLRRKTLIAVISLLCTVFSALCYKLMPVEFSAEAILLVAQSPSVIQDPNRTPAPEVASIARIATTDDVLTDAVTKLGIRRFTSRAKPAAPGARDVAESLKMPIIEWLASRPEPVATTTRDVTESLKKTISVKGDPRSNLIEISARSGDAGLAADVANAVAEALISKQFSLTRGSDAVRFAEEQRRKLESEAAVATAKLTEFGRTTSIYSISDQRQLLLRRESELSTALSNARASAASAEGRRASVTNQLRTLKQVTSSPFVSGVVNQLGTPEKPAESDKTPKGPDPFAPPPLLMVKVYQDAMVELLKVNSELGGAKGLESALNTELSRVNADLAALASKQGEFDKLQRSVAVATAGAESLSKRIIDEQFADALSRVKLTQLRVVQEAEPGTIPVFPRLILFLFAGMFGGFALSSITCLLLEYGPMWSLPGRVHSISGAPKHANR